MRLDKLLVEVLRRTAEIERRFDGMVKQGPVAEVDPKSGTVRVRLGGSDKEPMLSPPIPYAQIAGGEGSRAAHGRPANDCPKRIGRFPARACRPDDVEQQQ